MKIASYQYTIQTKINEDEKKKMAVLEHYNQFSGKGPTSHQQINSVWLKFLHSPFTG